MSVPLFRDTLPPSVRHFNIFRSIPRTFLSTLKIVLGMERAADVERPILLTFSISEDYARVWHYFARKAVGPKWQILIGDSSGGMDPIKFSDAKVIKVPNHLYHGAKIDFFLKNVIGSNSVFLCDDDKYLLFDPSEYLRILDGADVGAISLSPRHWYKFRINGEEHAPMGSYALMFRPDVIRNHHLNFQSPSGIESAHKIFAEGSKNQKSYDTADYANEQMLLRGLRVITEDQPDIVGFDGLSAPRLLLMRMGKEYVKTALQEALHYKEGSMNGSVMKAVYGIVVFEQLFRDIFKEKPKFISGFTRDELRAIVNGNQQLDPDQRKHMLEYFETVEATYQRLHANL